MDGQHLAVPYRHRRVRLHGGMVLIGRGVGGVDLHRRVSEAGVEIADRAVGGKNTIHAARVLGVRARRMQIIVAWHRCILHTDHRGGGAGLLERLSDNEGDGEAEILDLVGIERGLCAPKAIVQIDRTPWRLRRRIVFGHNEQDAGCALCVTYVDTKDAAFANPCGNDEAICGATLRRIFERIRRPTRHLQPAIDAIERKADRPCESAFRHDPYSSTETDCVGQGGVQGA
jgi:hypothetical protein